MVQPFRRIRSTSSMLQPPMQQHRVAGRPGNALLATGCAALICTLSLSSVSIAADSDADNTKRNRNNDAALTPLDQSNDPADIKIVAAIRSAITDDDALSTYAQNLKVIVRGGAVTLRGPVQTAAEKTRVEQLAKSTQGVTSVDNQISVKH